MVMVVVVSDCVLGRAPSDDGTTWQSPLQTPLDVAVRWTRVSLEFACLVTWCRVYDLLGRWVEWNERQPAQSRLYTPHSRLNSYSRTQLNNFKFVRSSTCQRGYSDREPLAHHLSA